ncbi:MAG: exodeoxyribonuclease V subunit alpha [Victivallales bacterium]|jgi:exodeoxyribonuclease V alpha subunit|nr:exodeoxyribonuclease V subunit alpha [Victivallales bacterium]
MSQFQLSIGYGFEMIDVVFADFLDRYYGKKLPEEVGLAGALASRAVREGHNCCNLELWANKVIESATDCFLLPDISTWRDKLSDIEFAPLFSLPTAPLMLDQSNRLYLRKYYTCEQTVSDEIKKRVRIPLPPPNLDPGELSQILPFFASKANRSEVDHQQLAIFTVMCNSFSIITGGPGTGKTTVVAALLALELKRNPKLSVALVAPTGKAHSRLAESLLGVSELLNIDPAIKNRLPELPCSTIHRLLGMDSRGKCRFDKNNPLPYDLLIVDESSMISLLLMAKLLTALPPCGRIVLLGDKNQLASVEAGAVFSDLCDAAKLNALRPEAAEAFRIQTGWQVELSDNRPLSGTVAELSENHRFANAVHIGEFSRAIRELTAPRDDALAYRIAACNSPDFSTRPVSLREMEHELALLLHRPVYDSYSVADLKKLASVGDEKSIQIAFAVLNSFKILCAMRNGKRGVEALNALAGKILKQPDTNMPGVPLLITRNDASTGLFNGDVGLVTQIPNTQGVQVVFPNHDRAFNLSELPEYETVYAMTVHKSQGSGFRNVLLILPDEANPVLTRELLYTGITRAEERLELWSSAEIITESIAGKTVRQSGLGDRLTE